MSDNSSIEWTDATWNPVTGCTKVSPGCDHCYAETFAERWRGTPGHHFENGFDVTLRPERLDQPLRWKKPRRIFVNSMSDLFHDAVPDEFIARVFATMAVAKHHTFQLLTKRHARMRSLLSNYGWWTQVVLNALEIGEPGPTQTQPNGQCALLNVWLGVSVEDQKWADIRVPALIQTPAAVRFLSCEPLVDEVNLPDAAPVEPYWHSGIDWVIVGGESGPGARPMDAQWAHSLVEQCRDGDVAVFVKQMGSVWASDWNVEGKSVRAHGDSKGGNWDYWPADLRVREFPIVEAPLELVTRG